MKAHQNSQVTNLGVAHKIDGVVIDITDTAMQRQTRLALERKYEDTRIVERAKAMMRMKIAPEAILELIGNMVATSKYNEVVPAR